MFVKSFIDGKYSNIFLQSNTKRVFFAEKSSFFVTKQTSINIIQDKKRKVYLINLYTFLVDICKRLFFI